MPRQRYPNWTIETSGGSIDSTAGAEGVRIENSGTTEAPTFEIPSLGINIKCKFYDPDGPLLLGDREDSAEHITFLECEVESDPNHCQVKGPSTAAVGTIETGAIKSELKTVGTTAYDFYIPVSSPFVTIDIGKKTGKTCPVSGTFALTGSIASSLPASKALATPQSFSFSKAIQEAANAELIFGTKPAFLKATFDSKLVSGLKFGVDW